MSESAKKFPIQQPEGYQPQLVPPSLRIIHGRLHKTAVETRESHAAPKPAVPALAYDGGNIVVPMAAHDEAVDFFMTHMGWKLQHQFDNRPSHPLSPIIRERKTLLGFGSCIQSVELREDADPLLTTLTADTRVRWCWRTRDIAETHAYLREQGVRVGQLYDGPGGNTYFDFWATNGQIMLTAQGDPQVSADDPRFVPSWTRIGVSDLSLAKAWYENYVGMRLLDDRTEEGYLLMGLDLEHHPDEYSMWVLEASQERKNAAPNRLDGAARPNCVMHDKQLFAEYHAFLRKEGVIVSDILGYPPVDGFSWFHFYDRDGNRFDVYRY